MKVLHAAGQDLDWPILAARAREWRVSVAVWAALVVAREKEKGSRKQEEKSAENGESTRVLIPAAALDALEAYIKKCPDHDIELTSGGDSAPILLTVVVSKEDYVDFEINDYFDNVLEAIEKAVEDE